MRTSYSRRGRPRFSISAVASVALVALIIVVVVLWRAQAAAALWRVLTPVYAVRNALQGGEVESLRAQLASTTAQLADRNALYQENLDLKMRLGRDATLGPRTLAAVVAWPPAESYDSLMLDVGTQHGIAVSDKVWAGGSTAIGTISAVYPTTARATLYSSPGSQYQAQLVGTTGNVSLNITGQGGGSFVAQVPAGTPVVVGEPVVFAGIAEQMAGVVSAVQAPAGESFETIYLSLPVNLYDLRFVEVSK